MQGLVEAAKSGEACEIRSIVKGPIDVSTEPASGEGAEFISGSGIAVGEGLNTEAHRSPRGGVLKEVFLSEEETRQRARNIMGKDRVPDHELCFWDDFGAVRMEEADLSHAEAVERLGIDTVIKKDFEMLEGLADQGIWISDFKPANIGYFIDEEGSEPVARPIDLYDKDSLTTEGITSLGVYKTVEVYLEGDPGEGSGLLEQYGYSWDEGVELLAENVSENSSRFREKDYLGIEDLTREIYERISQD